MRYIFANWKIYLDLAQSREQAKALSSCSFDNTKVSVVVFPQALSFVDVKNELSQTNITVGAQNVGWSPLGAYTGELSAYLFSQAGAKYALVGHSERRHIFLEDDEAVAKKLSACLDANIIPVLCVGETQADVDAGKTEYRLRKQLITVFDLVKMSGQELLIAYEPVWAISSGGVGKPCPPSDAYERHNSIKEVCSEYGVKPIILYGGSVSVDNLEAYLTTPGIDGVLVGHASTKSEALQQMIDCAGNIGVQ